MIRLLKATKSYSQVAGEKRSGAEVQVSALRGIDLEIPAGQFVAIMGPSGCGKSTLLHILGGLDQLSSGEAYLGDQPLHKLDEKGLTQLRRTHVGFVFQFFNLLPTLTVSENVLLPAVLQKVSSAAVKQKCQELLEAVGIGHRINHRIHQLSGGEMQRAALARALIMNPKVLLADEPTGNLDSEASDKVINLFKEIGRQHKTTIVMVTHSREVARAADRIVEMRDGLIVSG